MKTLIITLNSKFIHTSLALRLLYVATYKKFDIDFKEYTIKDDLSQIVADILSQNIDVLAISTYIWNCDYVKELVKLIKKEKDIKIILGGPEVTYEPEYFLRNYEIDYVLSGEGEETLPILLDAIKNNKDVNVAGINYLKENQFINNKIALNCDLSQIEQLDSPYLLERDLSSIKDRIIYFESNRGCPYICQYCLSSLEKGVRYFSQSYVEKQLLGLIEAGARKIKFLDRSFNIHPEKALNILKFIAANYQEGQQFQFEINADVLDNRIIDYLTTDAPKGLFRFEIGIQSTYDPTNEIIKRRQNFVKLSEVITKLIAADRVELHLDLIAGLPYENFERFKKSFDDVFTFRAKELQLGFLKLLRGTNLRKDASKYGYVFQEEAPYEMFSNHVLTNQERESIHLAEDMLEKYWNSGRFVRTMNYLFDNVFDSPFDFFLNFGIFYQKNNYPTIGYQIDQLFSFLAAYLEQQNIDISQYLITDYLEMFKVKPKKWWVSKVDNQKKKSIIHHLLENKEQMKELDLNQELLFRYSIIEEFESEYLIAVYKDFKSKIMIVKK